MQSRAEFFFNYPIIFETGIFGEDRFPEHLNFQLKIAYPIHYKISSGLVSGWTLHNNSSLPFCYSAQCLCNHWRMIWRRGIFTLKIIISLKCRNFAIFQGIVTSSAIFNIQILRHYHITHKESLNLLISFQQILSKKAFLKLVSTRLLIFIIIVVTSKFPLFNKSPCIPNPE